VLKARPQIPQYPRISTALGQALVAALQGDMTAQEALDQAAEQANGFLAIPA
jgi:maltose-binding protein MalE